MGGRGRARGAAAAVAAVFAVYGLIVTGGVIGPTPAGATAATVKPDAFYGTWFDGLSPSADTARAEYDRQRAIGIGLVRQYVWWDRIETSPGVYNWSRTDQLVADVAARGMTVLPTLLYTPAFYSSKPAGSTSTAQFPPSDPATMARFAEAMVRRYGPNGSYWCTSLPPLPPSCRTPYAPIQAWEVWNEPDYPAWWKGAPNANEYAPLLQAVSAGIKRADPNAEVVLGALTNAGGSQSGGYLDQLYSLGVANAFDTITVNPYAQEPAGMVAFVRGTRSIADKNGDAKKPIRVTEYGWASGPGRPDRFTTESCQAALMYAGTQRLVQLRTELNIKSIVQFQWRDVPTTSLSWPHYAGLLRTDGSAKPSLGAFAAAVGERPTPAGLTLPEVCPSDRQADVSIDGGVADDSFSRTVSDGWGSAWTGGVYTSAAGTGTSFSVSGGAGRIEVPSGESRFALLTSTSAKNTDIQAAVSTDKQALGATGQLFTLVTRRRDDQTEYRVHMRFENDGTVRVSAAKVVAGVETVLGSEQTIPGLSHVAGRFITLRARLMGASPTTITAKAWASGQQEPVDWQLSRTDSEPSLQAAGAVGVRARLGAPTVNAPVIFSIDTVHVTAPK